MKKIIFSLLTVFLSQVALPAQSPTYIALGGNISYLRTEEGKSKPGISLGIGKEFYPLRSFNGFLGLDLTYTTKKFKLENKTWPSSMEPE